MTTDSNVIITYGKNYYESLQRDNNARYKSWEHCYLAFGRYKNPESNERYLDQLCLHLSFYLASWGMYRGSSFLLQKDYRVHLTAVQAIMQPNNAHLRAASCVCYLDSKKYLSDLFTLTEQLKTIYGRIRTSVYSNMRKSDSVNPVSDTLITKILLGTLGCVPAYDRFFTTGIKVHGTASSSFNPKSIRQLCEFYSKNETTLEAWRKEISSEEVAYPQMKILDMCFWQAGYDHELSLRDTKK